eukprot:403335294
MKLACKCCQKSKFKPLLKKCFSCKERVCKKCLKHGDCSKCTALENNREIIKNIVMVDKLKKLQNQTVQIEKSKLEGEMQDKIRMQKNRKQELVESISIQINKIDDAERQIQILESQQNAIQNQRLEIKDQICSATYDIEEQLELLKVSKKSAFLKNSRCQTASAYYNSFTGSQQASSTNTQFQHTQQQETTGHCNAQYSLFNSIDTQNQANNLKSQEVLKTSELKLQQFQEKFEISKLAQKYELERQLRKEENLLYQRRCHKIISLIQKEAHKTIKEADYEKCSQSSLNSLSPVKRFKKQGGKNQMNEANSPHRKYEIQRIRKSDSLRSPLLLSAKRELKKLVLQQNEKKSSPINAQPVK